MLNVKHRSWVWHFDSPVEKVWPVLADTARFNEAARLPKHEVEEIPQADDSVRYFGRIHVGPFKLEWEEQPVNWIANQWFRHCRYFRNGPLRFLCAHLQLVPEEDGCHCEYTVEVEPANWLGRVILAMGFLRNVGRTFSPLADNARDFAQGRRDTEFDCKPPKLASRAKERAAKLVAKIEATPHGHGLAGKLAEYVLDRQEVDVWAIRPLKLARRWGVPERHSIEVCLEAVKQGLLALRWDLLCPRCQVGKKSVLALDQLPTGSHCSSCNIDYDREYSKNVELAFYPATSIRRLGGGEYCLFGPMSTPHIKLHLTLEPGEKRDVTIDLPHGNYRLRTLEPDGEQTVEWNADRFPEVIADGETVIAGPPAAPGTVTLYNKADRKLTFIVEERVWMRDALTAHRATALQAFRDLFNEDVLRPGDNVDIDYITLMFTDLKGSTALYERIGDPQAYSLVREHYAIIGKVVREHNGAIVKTIGDAIMGAFANPADAVRCGIQMHADFAQFNATSGKEPVIIKLGLHTGRCIAVTLNNRLDYYGTAANKAARLESQSDGGDIVISPELVNDAGVKAVLVEFSPREEEAVLKGFNKPMRFLRITAEELAAKRRPLPNTPPSSESE
ncbi:MAG: adenylate/guanylate cyclase domain-containing protein [Acidiferrobacterales bacterium]